MVSKGEIASNLPLNNLLDTETIDNNRYMFLLSGNYIDEHDSDDRGNIGLITAKAFKKQDENSLFPEAVVLLDDIKEETNKTIDRLYSEIQDKNTAKEKAIDELQQMFLLNPDTVSTLKTKIKNTDTDEEILHKIYKSDAEIKAKQDAEIKQQVEEIEALLPTDDDYQEKLKAKVDEFVRTIPLQNRTALSQYVARRKLVLVVFEKILNKELEKLRNGGRIDEDILHNLIFQQSSDSPSDSDLWLINEEYVYFKGFSEYRLVDMQYEGKNIFDKQFSEEDKRYLDSLNEKRLTKRPDILLFPEEGKCIIIEFKAPDVNVSEHLNQIDFYARNVINASKMVNFLRETFSHIKFNLKQIQSLTDLSETKILVNSTPIGMKGKAAGVSPIDENCIKTLPKDAIVYDIVYNPLKTQFIKLAQKNGYKTITGLDMFVYQGAKAFEIWTGKKAKPEVMKMAALEELAG